MRRVGSCVAIALVAGALCPEPAQAKDLKNFVSDLFNGQGLVVNDLNESFESFSPQEASGLLAGTQALVSAINSNITNSLNATPFAGSMVSSGFNLETGLPITAPQSLGPIFAERAETLGKGQLDFGISFSHATFTELNGKSLNHLNAIVVAPAPQDDSVLFNINIGLQRDILGLTGTYGITPRWDVGIVVPIVHTSATASATATLTGGRDFRLDSFTATGTNVVTSHSGGDSTGLGDIALRTKYNVIQDQASLPDLSVLGQVTAPTGSERDLLGTGSTDILGELVLSKQLGIVAPHLNLGYEQAIGGLDQNNLRYVIGADVHITDKLTGAVDVIGRKNFGGVNTADFAIGARWRPFSVGILGAAFIVPINKGEGLRPDYIWTVTANFAF